MVQRKTKTSTQDIFTKRSSILTAVLLIFFLFLSSRLFYLQVISGAALRKQAEQQHSIYQKLLPSRGEIKLADKDSLQTFPVATNIQAFLVYAVPQDIENPSLTASALATVLGLDSKDILAKITDTSRRYVTLKKQLTDNEQQKIKDLALPGIFFDSEDTRFYPEHALLSQVLGFVGYNNQNQKVGLYGLEKSFQSDLAGQSGELRAERDNNGAWIFGTQRDLKPAVDGQTLVLTIDKTIQFEVEKVLNDTVTKHGADSGSVIVMNPKTGAILAMAGFPDFDLDAFNKVTDPKVFNNAPTTGNYEPGSTFKAITMAAAIDAGKITPQSTYVDTGKVEVDNFTIKNAEPGARGQQNMTQALDFSLNTGAVFAENLLGNSTFLSYIKKFGFGTRTGVELPETTGDLSNLLTGNITVNYDTTSFGQGITVTPIQLMQAYGALANNGIMMKPYIVQSKIDADGNLTETKPKEVSRPISSQAASTISAMLVDVVENGFGKRAAVPGYYIAGKTGTAQVAGKNGKYDPTNNIGSFIGYGPVENPQFLMLVRVDHPRDVQFAESTAGPAFGQLAQFILNYLKVAPTRDTTQKK